MMSKMPGRLIAGGAAALLLSSLALRARQRARRSTSARGTRRRARRSPASAPTRSSVREDGARREVLRVTPATTPMAVAILVDNSQAARDHISDIRRALTDVRQRARAASDPIAIIGVADRPTILRDYTTDQKQLLDGVGKVFAMPDSGATLLDAIVEISKGLREARGRSRGDGRPHDREHRVQHAALHRSARGAGEGRRDDARGRADHAGRLVAERCGAQPRVVLDRGPRDSGGTRTDVLASQAFEVKMKELAAILKSQHRVVYARPQHADPAAEDRRSRRPRPASRRAAARRADRRSGRCATLTCSRSVGDRRSALSVAALAVPARRSHLHAQAPGSRRRQEKPQVFRAGVEVVSLNVTVTDRAGPLRHRPRPGRILGLRRRREAGADLLQPHQPADRAVAADRLQRQHGTAHGERAGSRDRLREEACGRRTWRRSSTSTAASRSSWASPTRSTSSRRRSAAPRPAARPRCTTPSTSR